MQEKRIRKIKPFEELTFTDDFIFGKVMRKPNICKTFLEQILKIKIGHIEYINDQKLIDNYPDSKAVILDIYLQDEEKVINIEMQTTNEYNLPRRARYYQASADVNAVKPGIDYCLLKENYIIFICTFDPFKRNQPIYRIRNWCDEEEDLILNDGTQKIFLNTKSTISNLDEQLSALYTYIKDGKSSSVFTQQVESEISTLKRSNKERKQYMTLERKFYEAEQSGYKNGLAFGMEQGAQVKAVETAKSMLSCGEPLDKVSLYSGLSLAEVEKLK